MRRLVGGILSATLGFSAVHARADTVEPPVPAGMQGVWARHGRCDLPDARLTVTSHTARLGNGPFEKVRYDPDNAAIEWAEEGVVDNFEFGANANVLIHNTEGFGMPGQVGMARCGPDLARVPWPPSEAKGTDGLPPFRLEMTPEEGPLNPVIERRYTAHFSACQKRAVTTQDNAACFEAEFIRQDTTLNRVWKTTLERLPVAMRAPLRSAQRQWIADRDPFCQTIAQGFSGGTIAPVVYVDCRVEQTIRRTMWLESLR